MAAKLSVLSLGRCCRTHVAPICNTVSPLRSSQRMRRTIPRSFLAGVSRRAFSVGIVAREKKYTEEHEWIELDADGAIGTIGISTYAAKALGDVVYVELPNIPTAVKAGDTIGAVESVKSASDIMTPVSGTVVEANTLLDEKPGTINKGPEGEGWIARIKVEDKAELEGLMDEEAYRAFTEDA